MHTTTAQAAPAFDFQTERCGGPVMIVTHRRSGTHLMIDFIRRQFPLCQSWKWPGQNTSLLYLSMGGLARGKLSNRVARKIISRPKHPILKTHSLPNFDLQKGGYEELVRWTYERGHIVYGLRDCRPVMASLYAYMQQYDPKTRVSPGEFLRQRDLLPEFMSAEHAQLSRPAQWAYHVRAWVAEPNVLVFRYEDVLKQPRELLTALGEHLEAQPLHREPLLPPKFDRSFWSRVGRRLAMKPSSTAIISPRAPGVEHSWKKLFTADDLDFIWQEAGEVMLERGYSRHGDERAG